MFPILQVATVFLVAVAMALALAHALELPGKLRLDRAAYLAVQTIYYPGFTFGGLAEGLGIIATLVLLFLTPTGTIAFRSTLIAFVALIAMHAIYWIVTHPVNKFWLKDQQLSGIGDGFFAFGPRNQTRPSNDDSTDMWKRARDRWEYSHVVRAVLAVIALLALLVGLAS
jgi:Domain of unknown function (DUF1772)